MESGKESLSKPKAGFLGGLSELDRILRGELTRVSSLKRGGLEISLGRLSIVIIALAMTYGVCMGTFAVFRDRGPRDLGPGPIQVLASMIKVPLVFYLTLVVTLPSLYVFNALVGSRLRLPVVVRLVVASLGVMVAVLASLGTIVVFFSVTTSSYHFMILFNVAVFTVAGVLGLAFLLQTLHRLSIADSQAAAEPHRTEPPAAEATEPESALDPIENRALSQHVKTVFRLWVIVFALVGAQMGWVLRPFVGDPSRPFEWVRGRESNFFQAVYRTFVSLFS